MKQSIFNTENSLAPFALRIFLGMVIFPHGAQKLLGLFGGYGFSGTMGYFTDTIGLPWMLGFLIIILESVGAVVLIAGFATRIIAVTYVFLAVGIILISHLQNGFFMNWFGNQAGEGYEYFLLWIGMAISLAISGGGVYSIDRVITWKSKV